MRKRCCRNGAAGAAAAWQSGGLLTDQALHLCRGALLARKLGRLLQPRVHLHVKLLVLREGEREEPREPGGQQVRRGAAGSRAGGGWAAAGGGGWAWARRRRLGRSGRHRRTSKGRGLGAAASAAAILLEFNTASLPGRSQPPAAIQAL